MRMGSSDFQHMLVARRKHQHSWWIALLLTGIAFAQVSGTIQAQKPDSPMLVGDVKESYSASVNVGSAGTALVGLWRGAPPGSLDVRAVGIDIPSGTAGPHYCFSATTRDGEYTARGPVRAEKATSGVLPVSTLLNSSYASQLAAYRAVDFAAHARPGANCAVKRSAPYLAAVGDGERSALVVAVNTSQALKVSARMIAAQLVIQGECDSGLPGRSRAFDAVCRFKLPEVGVLAQWKLELTTLPRAGPRRTDDFSVLLTP